MMIFNNKEVEMERIVLDGVRYIPCRVIVGYPCDKCDLKECCRENTKADGMLRSFCTKRLGMWGCFKKALGQQ